MVSFYDADTFSPNLSLRLVEESHIGRRKKEQQDFHGHVYIPAGEGIAAACLFVVADGVSMGSAGALASATAVETLLEKFKHLYTTAKLDPATALHGAFAAANNAVYLLAQDRPGMATTCATALVVGNQLVTAHVGDTRVYFERVATGLLPVTVDHSWTEEVGRTLVRQGALTDEQLAKDNRRHAITRAMGLYSEIKPDFNLAQLEPGDLIMLCTDGLWDMLDGFKFEDIVTGGAAQIRLFPPDLEQEKLTELSHRLVNEALSAGGRDNITLILSLINNVGAPVNMPGLADLLETTSEDVYERTNVAYAESYEDLPPVGQEPPTLSGIPYVPMGNPPVAPSDPSPTPKLIPAANEPTERPVPAFAFDGESQELPVFDSQSDTTPYRIQPPPDMILSKAQQLIALGNWEEGLADLLKLEELNPGLHGLFETNSGFFTRFLVENIETGEKGLLKAEKLIQHLKESGVERYNTVIFDEFLAESKEASEERNYQRATIYLKFALEIYPTDTRAKNLFDLNQMYLELKKPGLNSAEMLSIAQRLYARDPDFGAIQDDLAAIYMQLGDEAGKAGYEEEAISWYSLIAPLNPKDTRLVSLASHKQRAIEDDRKRRGLDPRPQATAASSPPKRTPLAEPNRQENETIIRLRERVSRVQKAWDGGRKEVGAEYIDLVEQLTAQLNPNPWLTTFPRVCYDYGKWLYDQKQYLEARPYFVKAQQLGMAAAQQRINEIDRLTQDRAGDKRAKPGVFDDPAKPAVTQPPLNPSVFDDDFFGEIKKPASSPSPTAVAPTDYAIPTTPPVSSAFGSIGNSYAPTPRNSKEAAFVKNSKSDKPEKLVGVSGTLRNPVLPVDPLQTAASREASRLGGTSIPNNARGDNSFVPIKLRRTMPGWILPAFFGLLILVALVFVGLNMSNQNATQAVVSPTANPALTITPSVATTPIVVSGGQVSAKVSGIKPEEFQVFLAVAGESPANWREMIVDSNGNWLLSTGVANRLDPAVKYAVIVRPRNTETRKYQQDLPLNAPLQTIFARNNLNYNPRDGLSVDMKIEPQAIHFYPLAGTEDQALTNGRYFGATRHFVSTAFFNFYNQGGNIGRFGFPISEEFDLEGVGRVQFFERGWLVQNPTDKLVKIGRVSPDVLALPPTCSFFPRPTAPAGSNVRTDAAFTTFVNGNPNVGAPLSAAFEVTEISGGKKKVQYFEFARLETNADGKPGVNLGLLGTEFARCKDWFRT